MHPSRSTLPSKYPFQYRVRTQEIYWLNTQIVIGALFFYCMYLQSVLYLIHSYTSPSEQELGIREAVRWRLVSRFNRLHLRENLRYIDDIFCVVIRPASTCIITTRQKANNFGINVIARGRKLYKIVLIIAVKSLDYYATIQPIGFWHSPRSIVFWSRKGEDPDSPHRLRA